MNVWAYATPICPAGGGELVIVGGTATLIPKACVADPTAFVAVTMPVERPGTTDGVPKITPVELSVKPAGSEPLVTE